MRTAIGWLLLISAGAACSGCAGIFVREAGGKVRGAKDPFMQIRPGAEAASRHPLVEYAQFELGAFTDEIGGKVPPALVPRLRKEFIPRLEKRGVYASPRGKTLLIRGRILHYEGKSTMGHLLGKVEEVIVRTELVDKESGKVVAVANCIGRSTSWVNRGVDKKAEGLAKSIAAWIAYLRHGE